MIRFWVNAKVALAFNVRQNHTHRIVSKSFLHFRSALRKFWQRSEWINDTVCGMTLNKFIAHFYSIFWIDLKDNVLNFGRQSAFQDLMSLWALDVRDLLIYFILTSFVRRLAWYDLCVAFAVRSVGTHQHQYYTRQYSWVKFCALLVVCSTGDSAAYIFAVSIA